jgi:hypothetical protein
VCCCNFRCFRCRRPRPGVTCRQHVTPGENALHPNDVRPAAWIVTLAYEVLAGNTSDKMTLRDFLHTPSDRGSTRCSPARTPDQTTAAWPAARRAGALNHGRNVAGSRTIRPRSRRRVRAVFHIGLRQTEGLIGSIVRLLGLDLSIPDHSTLSKRAETLALM